MTSPSLGVAHGEIQSHPGTSNAPLKVRGGVSDGVVQCVMTLFSGGGGRGFTFCSVAFWGWVGELVTFLRLYWGSFLRYNKQRRTSLSLSLSLSSSGFYFIMFSNFIVFYFFLLFSFYFQFVLFYYLLGGGGAGLSPSCPKTCVY